MKRLLFIVLVFISTFSFGQVTPKASSTFSFGWLDVRSFGAVGDSSTDCTTAIRAALAEAARYRTTLYFPSGNYVVSDTFAVYSGVSIVGAGGNGLTNDVLATAINKSASTNILQRTANSKTFVVGSNGGAPSNTGINFRDLNIIYQAGGTPSAGSGIYVYDGGNYTLERVGVRNFYDNIVSTGAAYWTMHSCWVTSAAHVNLTITNLYNPDFGDMSISDCFFASGQSYVHPYADIYWKSSGGFKCTNTKFNVTTLDTTHNKMFGIYMDNTDGGSVDMFFNNLSIEGFDSCAIRSRFHQGSMQNILINNVQTFTITNAFDAAINIEFDGVAPGSSGGIMCINNVVADAYIATSTYPVIQLTRCSNVKMSNIINYGYLKEWDIGTNSAKTRIPIERLINASAPEYVTIASTDAMELNVASAVTGAVLAPVELKFTNGALQTGKITGNGQWFIGSTTGNSIQSSYPFVHVRKDTTADLDMGIYNAQTSGTATAASVGVKSNGAQGLFRATGSTFTPAKNFGASTVGIYTGNNFATIADGGTWSAGNINSDMIHIQAAGRQVGIACTNEAAMFQIGSGSNIVFQTNGANGQLLAVTGGNTLADNTTAISGTVAEYSINAFGINPTSASNTGVTHTSSATVYIAGAPTAGTNVTITNPWALKINAGKSFFGGDIMTSARVQQSKGSNVASANDLTLGAGGNLFHITGTTTVNAITATGWQAGSVIRLIFDGSATVKNNTAGGGGTAVMLLAGGVDFSATANDVLTLTYDGTSWFECSRSVN